MTEMFAAAVKQLRLEEDETRIVWLMCAAMRDPGDRVELTVTRLTQLTGLYHSEVRAALDRLVQLGLLTRDPNGWHTLCSASASSELAPDPDPDPEKLGPEKPGSDPEKTGSGEETQISFLIPKTHTLRKGEERRGEPQTRRVNSPDSLMALWNATVTVLPKVSTLNQSRRRHAIARLTEYPNCDFAAVIRRLDSSPFCRGENQSGWRANFDFFLRPTTIPKTIEGVYDARPVPPVSSRNLAASEAWLAARRRARQEDR